MLFQSTFVLFFFSLTLLAVVHYTAILFSLYWLYPLLDVPMHILGGIVIGLGSQTALFIRYTPVHMETFLRVAFLTLGIGIGWEIFEWYFVIVDMEGYAWDTAADLVYDLMGGFIGFWVARTLARAEM